MGNQLSGRLGSNSSRQTRTNQADVIYSYSLNRSYFSNFFIMGGERFEASNPEYLFGENYDLNYLSCSNPQSFPYKQSQSFMLTASGKRLNGRTNIRSNSSRNKTVSHLKSRSSKISAPESPQPSQALKCLINIRKETLRLVKVDDTTHHQSQSISTKFDFHPQPSCDAENDGNVGSIIYNEVGLDDSNGQNHNDDSDTTNHPLRKLKPASSSSDGIQTTIDLTTSTCTATRTSCYNNRQSNNEHDISDNNDPTDTRRYSKLSTQIYSQLDGPPTDRIDHSEEKSRGRRLKPNDNRMYQNYQPVIDLEQIDRDTLNKENLSNSSNSDTSRSMPSNLSSDAGKERLNSLLKESTSAQNTVDCSTDNSLTDPVVSKGKRKTWQSPIYNLEFNFDIEVDCSVRIYYFCKREIAPNGIVYKPLHASYKSKIYHFRSGLNQKFQQLDHTFQPDLFDEESLCYKPFDQAGNFDPTALFPVVIHCVAQDGSYPRQSHSLVAIVEKNQNDGSYSIKPLKQLLFIDGLQYLLQEIYGIENKHLGSKQHSRKVSASSMQKLNSVKSAATYSDMGSTSSIDKQVSLSNRKNQLYNLSDCAICMSEERDTLLLPCRHLCLCDSCAHCLRYQSNNCPICRAPFRALIHIRAVHKTQNV